LTYSLGKGFARMLATIGIDDETQGRGHVVFRVIGDGKTLFPKKPEDGAISGGEKPRDIDIDVSAVDELTLVVDFGEEMHIFDRADWAGARLIRK